MNDKFLCDQCGYQFQVTFRRIFSVQQPLAVVHGEQPVDLEVVTYDLCNNCMKLVTARFVFAPQNRLRVSLEAK